MRSKVIRSWPAILLVVATFPAAAEEVNNGTNPTLLSTSAGIQAKYNGLLAGRSSTLFEAFYTQPFGEVKNMALGVTLPYASGPVDKSFGLGDVAVKFTHVPMVTKTWGLAYSAELVANTAARPDLGSGQTSAKLSGFYARFLENGDIFAPAVVQQITLGDPDRGRSRIDTTTLDFYYVPKLSDPRFFMTFDPAVVFDWQRDATYGSLTTTFGMMTGKVLGGAGQVYLKPQILAGGQRPADWSVQVGFKVLGF